MNTEIIKNNDIFIESTFNCESLNQDYNDSLNSVNRYIILTGYCTKCDNDGNLTIVYGNTNCIMLRNDITTNLEEDGLVHKSFCQNKVGVYIKFKVKKIENNIVYVSRKEIIEELRYNLNNELNIGDIVKGIITNINEKIGCFLDIGADYIAMLPKKHIEHIFVTNITDHVKIGDEIKTVVKDLVRDNNGKISEIILNRLPMLPTFEELVSDYSIGDVVLGEIKSITNSCIFVQITKHLNIYCDFNSQIKVESGQKVRIKLKHISDTKIRGTLISRL